MVRTSLTGIPVGLDMSRSEKVWQMLQSLGNVASAFSFSLVLIEIQVHYEDIFQTLEG